MLHQEQAKSLYQMQAHLIDTKVELSVSKVIAQVIEQFIQLRNDVRSEISGLRHEMHTQIGGLRHEMHVEISGLRQEMLERFTGVESRLSSVETALGKREKVRDEIRTRFFDYAFKTGWLIGIVAVSSVVSSLSLVILTHTSLLS